MNSRAFFITLEKKKTMKFYIKYMHCQRCVHKVEEALLASDLHDATIYMGEIKLAKPISGEQINLLRSEVSKLGMELIDDKKSAIIEQTKTVINDIIDQGEDAIKTNLSDYLSEKLNYNYTYLANLFSEYEGVTIAHYVMVRKIEKVKELMLYYDLNLTEISYKMHYSSVAHLSNQFKKVTGMTPSQFKSLIAKRKVNLDM